MDYQIIITTATGLGTLCFETLNYAAIVVGQCVHLLAIPCLVAVDYASAVLHTMHLQPFWPKSVEMGHPPLLDHVPIVNRFRSIAMYTKGNF